MFFMNMFSSVSTTVSGVVSFGKDLANAVMDPWSATLSECRNTEQMSTLSYPSLSYPNLHYPSWEGFLDFIGRSVYKPTLHYKEVENKLKETFVSLSKVANSDKDFNSIKEIFNTLKEISKSSYVSDCKKGGKKDAKELQMRQFVICIHGIDSIMRLTLQDNAFKNKVYIPFNKFLYSNTSDDYNKYNLEKVRNFMDGVKQWISAKSIVNDNDILELVVAHLGYFCADGILENQWYWPKMMEPLEVKSISIPAPAKISSKENIDQKVEQFFKSIDELKDIVSQDSIPTEIKEEVENLGCYNESKLKELLHNYSQLSSRWEKEREEKMKELIELREKLNKLADKKNEVQMPQTNSSAIVAVSGKCDIELEEKVTKKLNDINRDIRFMIDLVNKCKDQKQEIEKVRGSSNLEPAGGLRSTFIARADKEPVSYNKKSIEPVIK